MTELERIKKNTKGELPEDGGYGYFIVENVTNPEQELNVFKNVISIFLENPALDTLSPKWEKLLPKQFVEFVDQLEEDDYGDDLLSNIPRLVDSFREVRGWEWYSSELLENGFEVVYLGEDVNVLGRSILHHQGLPFTSLYSERGENFYDTKKFGTDVLSYKTFDKKTFELKNK